MEGGIGALRISQMLEQRNCALEAEVEATGRARKEIIERVLIAGE